MVQIDEKELSLLFQQGIQGNASSFVLLARRLVSRLKKSDPSAAQVLAETLLSMPATTRSVTQPVDADSRRGLLREDASVVLQYEPIWPPEIASKLARVIEERKLATKLRLSNLEPIKALLFKGPPGVGKTMACQWLARELGLPLLTLDLATVMSSLLGKTGTNVRAVIDYGREFPCVLLLDEFDSIAKRRDDDRDVGELKRLVTVLLQAIDEWPSTSLLVAATNHPELLDPAVWRRFDLQLEFDVPSEQAITQFLLAEDVSAAAAKELASSYIGSSYADLRRFVQGARKVAVLSDRPFEEVLAEEGLNAAADSQGSTFLRDVKIRKLAAEGVSHRDIAQQLGISHPTVGRTLKKGTRN
ncbi:AAA family ATPase [Cupriavidus sp. SW-Y-13]|uniref:AAA family ATPase n=1 Tax=Cupriavidus sp. SW-Y-13 TaxID=2653854 RepID=UPI001365D40C|nr:AAA family ATPase [Cupriavidus sp. SW-Y-13]MWL87159.1 AAA family ATPase [Cupriavidus sp. SW-Y-13]